jgi:hypothetical protein
MAQIRPHDNSPIKPAENQLRAAATRLYGAGQVKLRDPARAEVARRCAVLMTDPAATAFRAAHRSGEAVSTGAKTALMTDVARQWLPTGIATAVAGNAADTTKGSPAWRPPA